MLDGILEPSVGGSVSIRTSVPQSYIDAVASDLESLPDPIRDALLSVPRHRFLDGWYRLEIQGLQANFHHVVFDRDAPTDQELADIYSNQALMTEHDGIFPTSSTSQPSLVAHMLEILDVHPGMRILEIGTGTGYNAALLAELCGVPANVYTIEYQPNVAERARRFLREEGYGDVHVIQGDGVRGVEGETRSFDRIIATVGCSDISRQWVQQLAPDGILLAPLRHGLSDPLARFMHDPGVPGDLVGRIMGRAGFMKIQGALEWQGPWQTLRNWSLPESPDWCVPIPPALALSAACGHPFYAANHWGFRFYLSLRSQPLWYDDTGYGLADKDGHFIVKLTNRGIEGYTLDAFAESCETLRETFLALMEEWCDLGSPAPTDYALRLSPRAEGEVHSIQSSRTWCIERPQYRETLRLL
jgi:protein-L-isoaspartate(D-aspartate) O-methyltransferase